MSTGSVASGSAAYETFAGQVREAVNKAFYDPVNKFYDWPYDGGGFGPPPTPEEIEEINANQFQTDNVLPIALDLVPEEDRQALCQNLLDDVRVPQESHITTGATVLKDVLPVLSECGDPELGYAAAINPTFPGWGYWFLTLDGSGGSGGETIIVDTHWEAWYEEARSRNHAFRGTIDNWLYEYVAGIRPTAPAYREIQIKPYPVGDLTEASAHITSPPGEVSSGWKRYGERLRLRVHIPVGATAKVLVPVGEGKDVSQRGGARFVGTSDGCAEFQVGSGDYKFWTK